ncbi:MAG: hypothetical protein OXT69_09685 [Candidatus Poribacteria bacterium]|nr:hypothetical protein [Candidatus Poribacteria bacterium]
MSNPLDATRDILIAYIEKYPMSTSAYSANMEKTMRQLREDVIDFAKEMYRTFQELEEGAPPPEPPRRRNPEPSESPDEPDEEPPL